jgi:hypothetical protein
MEWLTNNVKDELYCRSEVAEKGNSAYICIVMSGSNKFRTITIYKQYFPEFLAKQRQKVKDKIIWTFKLIEEVQPVPETYLKHLRVQPDCLK